MQQPIDKVELTKKLHEVIRINEKMQSLYQEYRALKEQDDAIRKDIASYLSTEKDIVIRYKDSLFVFKMNKDGFVVVFETLYQPVEITFSDEDDNLEDSPAAKLWAKLWEVSRK